MTALVEQQGLLLGLSIAPRGDRQASSPGRADGGARGWRAATRARSSACATAWSGCCCGGLGRSRGCAARGGRVRRSAGRYRRQAQAEPDHASLIASSRRAAGRISSTGARAAREIAGARSPRPAHRAWASCAGGRNLRTARHEGQGQIKAIKELQDCLLNDAASVARRCHPTGRRRHRPAAGRPVSRRRATERLALRAARLGKMRRRAGQFQATPSRSGPRTAVAIDPARPRIILPISRPSSSGQALRLGGHWPGAWDDGETGFARTPMRWESTNRFGALHGAPPPA